MCPRWTHLQYFEYGVGRWQAMLLVCIWNPTNISNSFLCVRHLWGWLWREFDFCDSWDHAFDRIPLFWGRIMKCKMMFQIQRGGLHFTPFPSFKPSSFYQLRSASEMIRVVPLRDILRFAIRPGKLHWSLITDHWSLGSRATERWWARSSPAQ